MGNTRKRKRGQKIGRKKIRRYQRFWSRIFSHCEKTLLAYARKLTSGDESRARDIVQEVFLRIWKGVPNPTLITNHGAYLLRVTRNVSNQIRPLYYEVQLDQVLESDPGNPRLRTAPDILEIIEREQRLNTKGASRKDEAKYHLRIKLYLDGHTVQEIAKRLNEKESHTKYKLSILRKKKR